MDGDCGVSVFSTSFMLRFKVSEFTGDSVFNTCLRRSNVDFFGGDTAAASLFLFDIIFFHILFPIFSMPINTNRVVLDKASAFK